MESLLELHHCHGAMGALDARFALKGSAPQYAPDRTFDTEHIRLEVSLSLQRESLTGRCQTTLRALADGVREMVFDAVHFQIKGVRWNGAKAAYTYKEGKLTVRARKPLQEGERVTVEIDYHVEKPKLGLYFIKPNRFYPRRPTQVWTQGEDEYSRYWFPCFDSPSERTTTEVIATVPHGFTAVSNGKLILTTNNRKKGTSTFHYRQDIPHATYLVTLTVGRFSVIRDKWRKTPVLYYCEKGREADARRAFWKTPKMLEFFSSHIGVSYPYAKYAQIAAADFIYGGMENTSATTQTDSALLDERVSLDYTSDELVAHELAHQWFGDYLTCKDWSHAWLNESFATYFDPLFKRFDKGEDEFRYALFNNAEAYFAEDKDHYRRAISTKIYKRPTDLFDRHLYEKGSVVLHMLHRQLGEKLFWKAIKTYVRKNAGRVVETLDLINAIEEATGRNMRRFFDQWVFGAGHPEFKIRWWWDAAKKEVCVRVVQTHAQNNEAGLFHVRTEVLVQTGDHARKSADPKRFPVVIDKKSHLFKFSFKTEPEMVLFDPDHAVLKKVDFPKSEKELLFQLTRDSHVAGRIEACRTLGKLGGLKALAALRVALNKDSFWGVRAEAARAIGTFASEEAAVRVLLEDLDSIDHPKVRRAVYAALRGFKSGVIGDEISRRLNEEKSYFVEAEGILTLAALNHSDWSAVFTKTMRKDSWNDVLRIAAVESLALAKPLDKLDRLFELTKPGSSQRLRMAATRTMVAVTALLDQTRVQTRLIELTDDPFLLVQIAAVRALHQIGDERAVPALKKLSEGDRDGRLKRLAEEAVEKITKGFE